jgi:ribonuclease III
VAADLLSHDDTQPLQTRLRHGFRSSELLRLALTHGSHGAGNNERLEFLGDSLLNLVIAEFLYRRFGALREGALSRLRASLVRAETLAAIAREIGLGEFLLLGSGERRSGGAARDSILADALEAVIAAIYLDGGMDAARASVLGWYEDRLAALDPGITHKDAKTELQEWLQARRAALPEYTVAEIGGEAHQRVFQVQCRAAGLDAPVTGTGSSRRIAEQEAARAALQQLRSRSSAS